MLTKTEINNFIRDFENYKKQYDKASNKKVHKKIFYGEVISTKNNKTITVLVRSAKIAPYYNKRFFSTKKYLAHDEKGLAKLGDFVKIIECRPLSARKHFRLLEIKNQKIEDKK